MFMTNNTKALENVKGRIELENGLTPLRRNHYFELMKNCEQYTVKPNGDQHWLSGNWVLTQWKKVEHPNPFESWNCRSAEIAREVFENHIDY